MKKFKNMKGFLAILLAVTMLFQQGSVTTILAGEEQAPEEVVVEGNEAAKTDVEVEEDTPKVDDNNVMSTNGGVDTQTDKTTASDSNVDVLEAQGEKSKTNKSVEATVDSVTNSTEQVEDSENTSNIDNKDLMNFVSSVQIPNTMKPGITYEFMLSFKESPTGNQFPDTEEMTYRLPSTLKFPESITNGTFNIPIVDSQGSATVTGNTYSIDKDTGIVTVKFNEGSTDEEKDLFKRLCACANTQFQLQAKVTLGETEGVSIKVEFGHGIDKTITIDNNHSLAVSKQGEYDAVKGEFDYTVYVTSTGLNENVIITDTIGKDAVQSYPTGFTVDASSNKTGTVKGTLSNPSAKAFTYTITSMTDGEIITLKYSAKINYAAIAGNQLTVDESKNTVSVKSTQAPNPQENSKDFNGETIFDWLQKSGSVATDITTDEAGRIYRTIKWTLTVNKDRKVSIAGKKIKDSIPSKYQDKMKYSGTGLTIKRTSAANNEQPYTVSWSELNLHDLSEATSWEYTIPTTDTGIYEYEISYTTKVDITDQMTEKEYQNEATFDGDKDKEEPSVTVPGPYSADVDKRLEEQTSTTTKWLIELTIPAGGLDSTWSLIEQLPKTTITVDGDDVSYVDKYITGSITTATGKNGLYDGESVTATQNSDDTVTINLFYTDSNGNQVQGVQGSLDGTDRKLIIYLSTTNNQDWINHASTSLEQEHTNWVFLKKNEKEVANDWETITFPNQGIEKNGWSSGNVNISETDGATTSVPCYTYQLLIKNPTTEPLTITDTFDATYLKYYERNGIKIAGSNNKDSFSEATEDGITAEVKSDNSSVLKINATSLPITKNGGLFTYYQITYSLCVKDAAALQALNLAAASANANDYKVALKNTAVWGNYSGEFSLDYQNKPLNKWISKWPSADNHYRVTFTLNINDRGADLLPDGDYLTITDTLSTTLRFVQNDVIMQVDGEEDARTPDYSCVKNADGQDVLTINNIPDGKKVTITYQADIIGTGNINYSNKAVLSGVNTEATVGTQWCNVTHSGIGSASNPHIFVKKVSWTSNNTPLAGAVFELYRCDGSDVQAVIGKDGPVTFKSDQDGSFLVEGNMKEYGWTLEDDVTYKLKETEAPAGYLLDDAKEVSFKVSSIRGDSNTYSYGDVIYVHNIRTNFQIKKTDQDGNPLASAGFTLYMDKECTIKADYEAVSAGNDVSGKDGIIAFKKLVAGTYYMKETTTPQNYAANDTVYTIVIHNDESVICTDGGLTFKKDKDGAEGIFTAELKNTFDGAKVKISKKAVTGTEELAGAILKITRNTSDGEQVGESWTSGTAAHEVELTSGTYVLTEVTAPDGYQVAESITFTVEADNVVKVNGAVVDDNTVLMIDQPLKDASLVLEATKTVDGGNVAKGETFDFQLLDTNGKVLQTKTNQTDGKITFDGISYSSTGTYTYTVKESGNKAGYVYDKTAYTVTVNVSQNDANLTASATYKKGNETVSSMTFNNKKVKGTSASLTATKTVDNKTPAAGETFDFVLKDSTGKILQTKKNDTRGKVAFDAISYDTAGTYTYTVEESGSKDGYTYDKTAYTATVVVAAKSDQDDQLEATVSYKKGSEIVSSMTFNNTKDKTTTNSGKGSVRVTKIVTLNGKPAASNAVYYAALFSDEACTQLASEVKALNMNGQYSTHITFDDMPLGVYYLSETDKDGTVFTGSDYVEVDINGSICDLTKDGAVATTMINNKITTEDHDYSYGSLTVTKKVMKDDKAVRLPEAEFYVALFADEDYTTMISDVETLSIEDASSTSVTFTDLAPGTYYLAETDEDGIPVDNDSDDFHFTATISDSEITLGENETVEATVTNTLKPNYPGDYDYEDEKTPTPTPTATPTATSTSNTTTRTTTPTSSTTTTTSSPVKTADETPLGLMLVLLMLSAGGILLIARKKKA